MMISWKESKIEVKTEILVIDVSTTTATIIIEIVMRIALFPNLAKRLLFSCN